MNVKRKKRNRYNELRYLIRRYTQAKVDESWIGTLTEPEDIAAAERRVKLRTKALMDFIKWMEDNECNSTSPPQT